MPANIRNGDARRERAYQKDALAQINTSALFGKQYASKKHRSSQLNWRRNRVRDNECIQKLHKSLFSL